MPKRIKTVSQFPLRTPDGRFRGRHLLHKLVCKEIFEPGVEKIEIHRAPEEGEIQLVVWETGEIGGQ